MGEMKDYVVKWNKKHPNKQRNWHEKTHMLVDDLALENMDAPEHTVWSRVTYMFHHKMSLEAIHDATADFCQMIDLSMRKH